MAGSARNISAFGHAVAPYNVESKDGFDLPIVEPDAVELLPVAKPSLINDGRGESFRSPVMKLAKQLPHPETLSRKLRHIELRRLPAGALLNGLQVLAQGFAIALLLVEVKCGLRVVNERPGQALIKRVWSFMAAASCFTSHSLFGSE